MQIYKNYKTFVKNNDFFSVPIYADKRYVGTPNNQVLEELCLESKIMRRGTRNKNHAYNKSIGKVRYRIEQVFGGIKRWLKGGVCRYQGFQKIHFQHVIEGVADNLYRINGLVKRAKDRITEERST